MGKKKKLVLDDLKVKSFVTALEDNQARNAKGGITGFCTNDCTEGPECETEVGETCDTCIGCPTMSGCTCPEICITFFPC